LRRNNNRGYVDSLDEDLNQLQLAQCFLHKDTTTFFVTVGEPKWLNTQPENRT
jgi:hypothetical protein